MKGVVGALVALVAGCSGETGDEDSGCAVSAPPIRVTLSDQLTGDPVEGASVQWDGVDCPEAGGGVYQCVPQDGGANQLVVIATNMRAYSAFQEIPAPSCQPAVFDVVVELQPGIAR